MDRGSYWSLKVRWSLWAMNKLVVTVTQLTGLCRTLFTGNVLARPCWLLIGCGNCRGAAIPFDCGATWFGRKLGAAVFKTVFGCCCSIRGTVIGGKPAERTSVIGLIQWLDCRQLFFATILSVLLGRCEVLFATVGKHGSFCKPQFNSWQSRYPLVPIWFWEGPKSCCILGKLWYRGFLLAFESWLLLWFGKFKLKVFSNAEFWANRPSACNWIVGSVKLKGFESEWLPKRFKFWIGGKRFCDVSKLSLKLIWAVSISQTSLFTRLEAISSFPGLVGDVNSWLVSLSKQGKGFGAFVWFSSLFFDFRKLWWTSFLGFLWWASSICWIWSPGSLDVCRNNDGCLGRGNIGGGWLKMLLLVCFSSISRWCWIRSLASLGAGVDCRDRSLLLEIMLTSSLMRLEDRLSWPSSSNRSQFQFIEASY